MGMSSVFRPPQIWMISVFPPMIWWIAGPSQMGLWTSTSCIYMALFLGIPDRRKQQKCCEIPPNLWVLFECAHFPLRMEFVWWVHSLDIHSLILRFKPRNMCPLCVLNKWHSNEYGFLFVSKKWWLHQFYTWMPMIFCSCVFQLSNMPFTFRFWFINPM